MHAIKSALKHLKNNDIFVLNTTYKTAFGSFGCFYQKSLIWYSCRERFHSVSKRFQKYFFSIPPERREAVVAGIHAFEEKLGLVQFTIFGFTNEPSIIYFEPSDFWKVGSRQHLLTIILRAAYLRFDPAIGVNSLWQYDYLKLTRLATEEFIQGENNYRGDGWVKDFSGFPCSMSSVCNCVNKMCVKEVRNKLAISKLQVILEKMAKIFDIIF